jgi:hypothetical protein
MRASEPYLKFPLLQPKSIDFDSLRNPPSAIDGFSLTVKAGRKVIAQSPKLSDFRVHREIGVAL